MRQASDSFTDGDMTIFSVDGKLGGVDLSLTTRLRELSCFFTYHGDFVNFSTTDSTMQSVRNLLRQGRIPFTERKPATYEDE